MRISIRNKILLAFSLFIGISGLIWLRSYYSQYLLHQKLVIIEMKNNLFNTILEARRYEKNFFLDFEKANIKQALDYLGKAENVLEDITTEYGKYTLAKDMPERLSEIKAYKTSLSELLRLQEDGVLFVSQDNVKLIQEQGHKITTELENIVAREGQFTRSLVKEAKTIHLIALVPVIILSILVALFLLFNVIRPLRTIERAIKKIAVGDFNNIPEIATGDEFESLVTSLNNMILELKRRSEELVQAKKLASLGRLTSGVAHELNNPLNNISTSVQILIEELENEVPKYHKELLLGTEKEVERGKNIVRALLEFSRARSFTMKRANFKDLINEALERIKSEIPDNIRLEVNVADDLYLFAGPERIERVLGNLIINAVQAMQNGGTITITACEYDENNMFSFQVQDSGSGIPNEHFAKIFDPFFTTKEIGKGSGLGLSIVYGIVEQHGGKISVSSEEDQGTTFTVSLPHESPNA
jgi:signal transduction histidine kinase